jgi:hypothetical protein
MGLGTGRFTTLATRVRAATALALLALGVLALPGTTAAQKDDPPKKEEPKTKVGLLLNEPKACQGYTLLAPSNSTSTYLIDMEGRVVNTWKSDCAPGHSAYLLENGNLLRAGQVRGPAIFGGGAGGRVQEFTWDGKLVWDYTCSTSTTLSHHDICKLPGGNVLLIVWEKKPTKDVVAAGRRPETVGDGQLMADSILEVQATGEKTGKVVWEWHAWDHLIQDFDDKKPNHGDVGAHPELIDLNFGESTIAAMVAKPEELEKLRSIGYVGGAGRKPGRISPDWTHINAVAYNAELDQIMLSVHEFSEIWIIDHSTTKEEAASHKGGRSGKGGDLLYRWGNPRAHRAGTVKDQKLFGQHNAHWIPKGRPGEGHALIFNNGMRRTGGAYSSVDEIVLPLQDKGQYTSESGKPFGPEKPVWSYVAPKRTDFYAALISGAERLPNGNTLICSGPNGVLFEVTPDKETVWKYINPVKGGPGGPPGGPGGRPPFGGPPKLGELLPGFLRDNMNLSAEQKKDLEAAEKEIAEKLEKLLTDEQKKQAKERTSGFGPGAFPAPPQPGQLLPTALQERLKLTDEQKKELAELQKEADGKLAKILKEGQKKQLKEMQDRVRLPGGPPVGLPGGPVGFGGPGGGIFRALRYAPDYPGLAGKELKPGKTVEEIQAKDPPKEPKDK